MADDLDLEFSDALAPASLPPEAPSDAPSSKIPASEDAHDSVRAAIEQLSTADTGAVDQRPRGADGKFLPKVAADTTAAPAATKSTDPDTGPGAVPAQSSVPAGPPAGWSAEAKLNWQKLTPAIQAAVVKREQEVSDGFRQKSEEMKRWSGIDQMLAPRRQQFASLGYQNDGQVIKSLLDMMDTYQRDPAGLVRQLASQAGIDIRQLSAQMPTASASPARAVQQAPVAADQNAILSTVNQLFVQRDAQTQIERFKSDPAHPHFDAVRADMAAFIGSRPNMTLDQAYEQAVWAHPQIRQQLLADQANAAKSAVASKTTAARQASVSPRSGAPSAGAASRLSSNGSGKSAHDSVAEAIAQLSGEA